MKVKINKDTCIGTQDCVARCPEIFEVENNKSNAKVDQVPGDLEAKCKDAISACPVQAISMIE